MDTRVAVIGAGASGLVAARWLMAAGFDPVVLERSSGIGGLWRPDDGLAYPSLRTNTSKQKTAFSELAFDPELPDFPGRAAVLAYLERYAERSGLRARIRTGVAVRSVIPVAAGHDGWEVDGERFGRVVVATGLFSRPVAPDLPGAEGFLGAVVHTAAYRGAEPYRDKDVVIVGGGSSAADVARELVDVARTVTLALRGPVTFTPRIYRGRPFDHRATRLARRLPVAVRTWLRRRAITDEYRRQGAARAPVFGTRTTPGADIIGLIAAGRILLRPAVRRLGPAAVHFADGSSSAADAIICGTGYAAEFPFLPDGIPGRIQTTLELYRLVFPPDLEGIAFVGLSRVNGPVFPVAEMQARWVAAVFAGHAPLPGGAAMRAEVQARVAAANRQGTDPMRVELLDYLDEIGARIGVRPSLLRHPGLLVTPVRAADYLRGGHPEPVRH
ncbi:MAG: NAD(P)-binding domain-containing protein [Candidatus Limnocylindrales bacterium]